MNLVPFCIFPMNTHDDRYIFWSTPFSVTFSLLKVDDLFKWIFYCLWSFIKLYTNLFDLDSFKRRLIITH